MFYVLCISYVVLVVGVLFLVARCFHLPFFNALSMLVIVALPIEFTKVLIAPFYNGLEDDPYYIEAASINLLFLFLAVVSGFFWIKFFNVLKVPLFRSYQSLCFDIPKVNLRKKSLFFFLMYLVFFVATMVIGGGGELWIFNTAKLNIVPLLPKK